MSKSQTPIRAYEALITVLGSYLAINSFFQSSLYKTIATGLNQMLRLFQIHTISSQEITTIIPLLVTFLVSLKIVYDYVIGKPENIIEIYQLNLLLVTPEILSYSRLDWLNLIQRPQILEPARSPTIVYLSGAIILVGYLTLYFISLNRKTSRELTARGINLPEISNVFLKQSTLTIYLTLGAAVLSSVVFLAVDPFNSIVQVLIGQHPYNYLVYGVPGVTLLLLSLWYYLREQENS